jgi:hypothetical protein
MNKTEQACESVSVFARFRPSNQDDVHITIFEENTNLTSSLRLISQKRLREEEFCI